MSRPRSPGDDDEPVPDLARFDDAFAAAPTPAPLTPIPDGKYHVRVERVEITVARTSSRTVIKWTLQILGPHHVRRRLWRNHVLVAPAQLRWLKHDLEICGLYLDRLSDLPNHLDELCDLELEVTQQTRAGHTNLYFNRRLDPASACPF
jgi:hypothetical protein